MQRQPVPLPFALPQTQGGTAPVTVACTPAPGEAAAVGETRVTCTATDSRSERATCAFDVRVVAAPVLGVERILALGDSLTFGTTSRRPLRVIEGNNYGEKLQTLLVERYFDQNPTVSNVGVPGQWTEDLEANHYADALRRHNPQLLILLAGANDLLALGNVAIPRTIRALENMTRDAQRRGIAVVLSTLPPMRPGSSRGIAAADVPVLNQQILGLCARYGVPCADHHAVFGGDQSPLIGADGLHPTLAGYDRMAETYFELIVSRFER